MVEKIEGKVVQKILVTGAGGMLGSDLCEELSRDYKIVGLDVSGVPGFIHCDITDSDEVVRRILNEKPDLIIHAAAWTDVDACEREPDKARRVNEGGTLNVVQAASRLDVPLVYVSTDFVFDGNKKSPYTEEDTPNPLNVYSESKLRGELAVGTLNKYAIVRSGWLYGPNGKNFVDTILGKVGKGDNLEIVDDQKGSPTYTKDLARGIAKLVEILLQSTAEGGRYTKEIYHITNGGEVSWFDYAKKIMSITHLGSVKVKPITSSRLDRPAKRPAFSVLDNTKFEKISGFSMRPWSEALRDYLINRSDEKLKQGFNYAR